jgi:uncharacterized membrane protein
MPLFSVTDLVGLTFFLFAWVAYTATLAWFEQRKRGLNRKWAPIANSG